MDEKKIDGSEKPRVRSIQITTKDNPELKKKMDEASRILFEKNYELYKRLANK